VFAAAGRFDRYGLQMVVDGLIRLGGAVGLSALGSFPIVAYGVVLALAPLVSLVIVAGTPAPTGAAGEPAGTGWGRDVGLVTAGQLGSTLIIGAGPVAATLLAGPGEQVAVAVVVGVLMLARVPLLALYAAQAVQLPALVRLVADGRVDEFRRRVAATVGVVLAATAVAAVAGWVAGPAAVALALGPGFDAHGSDVAVVLAATMIYIGAALAAQALLAVDGHALAAGCWLAGVLTYALLLLPAWPVVLRVEAGFAGAGAVTLVLALACLRHRCRVLERPRVPVRA
jgi:hypothetical protein